MVDTPDREIEELRALIGSDRDPEGRAFAPLADALRRAGRHEEALDVLADGLERHPRFTSAHVVAGRIHRDRGETEHAVGAFRRVLDLDGDNVMALHGLGRMLVVQGETEEAGRLLSRAAELGYTTDLVEEGPPLEPPEDTAGVGEERPEAYSEEWPGAARWEEGADDAADPWAGGPSEPGEPDEATERFDGLGEPQDIGGLTGEDREETAEGDGGGAVEAAETAETAEEVEEAEEAAEAPVARVSELSDVEEVEEVVEVEGPRTRTMAELYVRQGMPDRAVRVYEHLVAQRPGDGDLRARLEELRDRGVPPEGADDATPSSPAGEPEAWVPEIVGGGLPAVEDVEAVALGMVESGHSEPVESPFSWTDREADEPTEGDSDRDSEPVSSYFAALLAYEPGRGRDAAPAPETAREPEGEAATALDAGLQARNDPEEDS